MPDARSGRLMTGATLTMTFFSAMAAESMAIVPELSVEVKSCKLYEKKLFLLFADNQRLCQTGKNFLEK